MSAISIPPSHPFISIPKSSNTTTESCLCYVVEPEISKREPNLLAPSDSYCALLEKNGLSDQDGIIYSEHTQKPLPALNEIERNRILEFLIQSFEVNGEYENEIISLGLKTSIFEVLKMLKDPSLSRIQNAQNETDLEIEIVGSAVYHLLGVDYLIRAFKENEHFNEIYSLFPLQLIHQYAERVRELPNDYDIRIWVSKGLSKDNMRRIGNQFIQFLAKKMELSDLQKKELTKIIVKKSPQYLDGFKTGFKPDIAIKQLAFNKFKTVYFDETRFHIVGLGDRKTRKIEFIIPSCLKRTSIYAAFSLRLSIKDLLRDPKALIVPKCDWGNGLQALSDLLAGIVTPALLPKKINEPSLCGSSVDFSKIDEADWPILMIAYAKGLNCRLRGVEGKYLEKFLEVSRKIITEKHPHTQVLKDHSTYISEVLEEACKNHLRTPYQAFTFAFKACASIQQHNQKEETRIDLIKILSALKPYFSCLQDPLNKPLTQIVNALTLSEVPFDVLSAVIELAAFIYMKGRKKNGQSEDIDFAITKNDGIPSIRVRISLAYFWLPIQPEIAFSKIISYCERLDEAGIKNIKILENIFLSLFHNSPILIDYETIFGSSLLKFDLGLNPHLQKCLKSPLPFLRFLGELFGMISDCLSQGDREFSNFLSRIPFMVNFFDTNQREFIFDLLENILLQNPYQLALQDVKSLYEPLKTILPKKVNDDEMVSKWIISLAKTRDTKLSEKSYALWQEYKSHDRKFSSLLIVHLANSYHLVQAWKIFFLLQKEGTFLEEEIRGLLTLAASMKSSQSTDLFIQNLSKAFKSVLEHISVSSINELKGIKIEKGELLIWIIQQLTKQGDFNNSYELLTFLIINQIIFKSNILAEAWLLLCQSYCKIKEPSYDQMIAMWRKGQDLKVWNTLFSQEGFWQYLFVVAGSIPTEEAFLDFWKNFPWNKAPEKLKDAFEKLYNEQLEKKLSEGKSHFLIQDILKNKSAHLSDKNDFKIQNFLFDHAFEKGDFLSAWAVLSKFYRLKKNALNPFELQYFTAKAKQLFLFVSQPTQISAQNLSQALQIFEDPSLPEMLMNDLKEASSCLEIFIKEIYKKNVIGQNLGVNYLKMVLSFIYASSSPSISDEAHLIFLEAINEEIKLPRVQKKFKDKLCEQKNSLFKLISRPSLFFELCKLLSAFETHSLPTSLSSEIVESFLENILRRFQQGNLEISQLELIAKAYVIVEKQSSNEFLLIVKKEICEFLANSYSSFLSNKADFWIEKRIELSLFKNKLDAESVNFLCHFIEKYKSESKFSSLPKFIKMLTAFIDVQSLDRIENYFVNLIQYLLEKKANKISAEILFIIHDHCKATNQPVLSNIYESALETIKNLENEQEVGNVSLILRLVKIYSFVKEFSLKNLYEFIFLNDCIKVQEEAWNFLKDFIDDIDVSSLQFECYVIAFKHFTVMSSPNLFEFMENEALIEKILLNENLKKTNENFRSFLLLSCINLIEKEKKNPKQINLHAKIINFRKKSEQSLSLNAKERVRVDLALIYCLIRSKDSFFYIEACKLMRDLFESHYSFFLKEIEDCFSSLLDYFPKINSQECLPLFRMMVCEAKMFSLTRLKSIPIFRQHKVPNKEIVTLLIEGLEATENGISINFLREAGEIRQEVETLFCELVENEMSSQTQNIEKILNHKQSFLFIQKSTLDNGWGLLITHNLQKLLFKLGARNTNDCWKKLVTFHLQTSKKANSKPWDFINGVKLQQSFDNSEFSNFEITDQKKEILDYLNFFVNHLQKKKISRELEKRCLGSFFDLLLVLLISDKESFKNDLKNIFETAYSCLAIERIDNLEEDEGFSALIIFGTLIFFYEVLNTKNLLALDEEKFLLELIEENVWFLEAACLPSAEKAWTCLYMLIEGLGKGQIFIYGKIKSNTAKEFERLICHHEFFQKNKENRNSLLSLLLGQSLQLKPKNIEDTLYKNVFEPIINYLPTVYNDAFKGVIIASPNCLTCEKKEFIDIFNSLSAQERYAMVKSVIKTLTDIEDETKLANGFNFAYLILKDFHVYLQSDHLIECYQIVLKSINTFSKLQDRIDRYNRLLDFINIIQDAGKDLIVIQNKILFENHNGVTQSFKMLFLEAYYKSIIHQNKLAPSTPDSQKVIYKEIDESRMYFFKLLMDFQDLFFTENELSFQKFMKTNLLKQISSAEYYYHYVKEFMDMVIDSITKKQEWSIEKSESSNPLLVLKCLLDCPRNVKLPFEVCQNRVVGINFFISKVAKFPFIDKGQKEEASDLLSIAKTKKNFKELKLFSEEGVDKGFQLLKYAQERKLYENFRDNYKLILIELTNLQKLFKI